MRPRRAGASFRSAATALACALLAAAPAPLLGAPDDSTSFRLEVGHRTDVTNEQYVDYGELFVDSAFVGARSRLASVPERRYGGFVSAGVAGTRDAGNTRYRLDTDALLGDRLSTAWLAGSWRRETVSGWQWRLDPEAGFRDDRTFDRDRREWRAALGSRVRRVADDGAWAGELRARADALRVSGSATDYLTDRQSVGVGAAIERPGLLGELRLGYGLTARAFPDSSSRDHLEHEVVAGGRTLLPGGSAVAVEARVARRDAADPGPVSRDDFLREEFAVEFGWLPGAAWGGSLTAEGEAIQYDRPDSGVYADGARLRGTVRLRVEPARGLTVRLESWLERSWCGSAPEEEYVECAVGPGLDWFGAGAWWDLSPRAGRRWPRGATADPLSGLAGGYDFYELELGADQPLGRSLRARLAASGRIVEHEDPSLDSRGLFLTAEIRWRVLGAP